MTHVREQIEAKIEQEVKGKDSSDFFPSHMKNTWLPVHMRRGKKGQFTRGSVDFESSLLEAEFHWSVCSLQDDFMGGEIVNQWKTKCRCMYGG